MSIELKPKTKESLVRELGVTLDDVKKAETKCDGHVYLKWNSKGGLFDEAFYFIHLPVFGKQTAIGISVDDVVRSR